MHGNDVTQNQCLIAFTQVMPVFFVDFLRHARNDFLPFGFAFRFRIFQPVTQVTVVFKQDLPFFQLCKRIAGKFVFDALNI